MSGDGSVVVLTGGIGGAKLVLGLSHVLPPDKLTAIVNTGDDFTHLGLRVSPDIDTLLYTLSGLADAERGWGRAGESWNFMDSLRAIGGDDWFQLGDRDLALHVERTRRLAAGETLSQVTAAFAATMGVGIGVSPMSDQPVGTEVETDEGILEFQRYFVARRCAPRVSAIRFRGADTARPSDTALAALARPDLRGIIVAPSNPWLSVDPVLSVPGMRKALADARVPVVVVTPLPGGQAVKGPTAKIMEELGLPLTARSIAEHYAGLATILLLDERDDAAGVSLPYRRADTIMRTLDDRIRVARAALDCLPVRA